MCPRTVEVLAEACKEAGTPCIVGDPRGESVELMAAARQRGKPALPAADLSSGVWVVSRASIRPADCPCWA
ncbi:MAG: hypothetical protein WAO08_03180 [Hyphomicrobiaceae bacterium]